jgi:hypothetical protein
MHWAVLMGLRVEWQTVISEIFWAGFIALKNWLSSRPEYFKQAIRNPETKKIAIEFCTEVAVLLAVFPMLDTLIANQASQGVSNTAVSGSGWLLTGAYGVAALFLIFAVIIAVGKTES